MPKFVDLTGQKFGRLTVIEEQGKDKWEASMWLCECNYIIPYKNKDCRIMDLAKKYKINCRTLDCRLKTGMSIKEALETPTREYKKRR